MTVSDSLFNVAGFGSDEVTFAAGGGGAAGSLATADGVGRAADGDGASAAV
jgi:hypothetical protein